MNLSQTSVCARRHNGGAPRRIGTAVLAAAAIVIGRRRRRSARPEPQSGEPVTVRWFVGLGTGAEPEQLDAQQEVVEEFNDSQDDIELEVEIVDNEIAFDDAGDADRRPATRPTSSARSASAARTPSPASSSTSSRSSSRPASTCRGYDQEQVEFWREETGELTALPFGVFPSAIYYNKDLFDEADLEYPPAAYGEPYADGDPWDMDKVAELAMLLTVDANGNDATSPDFDPDNVVQWGFHHQFNDDARAIGTFFGPGTLRRRRRHGADPRELAGVVAVVRRPDHRRGGAEPVADRQSTRSAQRNAFNTGNVAMAFTHLWYTCCVRDEDGNGREFWDIAVGARVQRRGDVEAARRHVPHPRRRRRTRRRRSRCSPTSSTTRRRCCSTPTAGCPPARTCAIRSSPGLDELFPQGVNWEVALDGLDRPDVPSHEGNMPNFDEAEAVIDEFEDRLTTEPNLDVAAAAEELRVELDADVRRRSGADRSGTEPAGTHLPVPSRRHGAGNDVGLSPTDVEARDDVDHRPGRRRRRRPTRPGAARPGRPRRRRRSLGERRRRRTACCSSRRG